MSQKFALMDTSINDLVNQGQLEILIGPVIFKNFLLNKDGRLDRWKYLSDTQINKLKMCLCPSFMNFS